jgi:hypothetical protein
VIGVPSVENVANLREPTRAEDPEARTTRRAEREAMDNMTGLILMMDQVATGLTPAQRTKEKDNFFRRSNFSESKTTPPAHTSTMSDDGEEIVFKKRTQKGRGRQRAGNDNQVGTAAAQNVDPSDSIRDETEEPLTLIKKSNSTSSAKGSSKLSFAEPEVRLSLLPFNDPSRVVLMCYFELTGYVRRYSGTKKIVEKS